MQKAIFPLPAYQSFWEDAETLRGEKEPAYLNAFEISVPNSFSCSCAPLGRTPVYLFNLGSSGQRQVSE